MPLLKEYLKFRLDIFFHHQVIDDYIPLGSQKTPPH